MHWIYLAQRIFKAITWFLGMARFLAPVIRIFLIPIRIILGLGSVIALVLGLNYLLKLSPGKRSK